MAALVLDWKKKLGFKHDPFEVGVPRPVKPYLIGLSDEKDMFNLFLIKDHSFGTISAEKGMGKTTFLIWIEEALREGNFQVHYLDAATQGKQAHILNGLLGENTSFLSRKKTLELPAEKKYALLIEKLSKRPHVILVDNAGKLNTDALAMILDLLERTKSKIVVAGTKDDLKTLKTPADQLRITIPPFTREDLAQMLAQRMTLAGGNGLYPLEQKDVDELVKQSEKNPAKLLKLARERVIERSLRAAPPPKAAPRPAAAKERPAKQKPSKTYEEKRFGFFNIRIARDAEPEKESPPPFIEEQEPAAKTHHEDAEAIMKILDEDGSDDTAPVIEREVESFDTLIKEVAGAKNAPAKKKKPKKR